MRRRHLDRFQPGLRFLASLAYIRSSVSRQNLVKEPSRYDMRYCMRLTAEEAMLNFTRHGSDLLCLPYLRTQ
jgi:hypothetical protein